MHFQFKRIEATVIFLLVHCKQSAPDIIVLVCETVHH